MSEETEIVDVEISLSLEVPKDLYDQTTEKEIEELVEFYIGLRSQLKSNPISLDHDLRSLICHDEHQSVKARK